VDTRLKQRLIGAAVLLALVVIAVPMFFSGHEQGGSATTSVSLGIPAQPEPPLQSKTLELGAPAPTAAAASTGQAPMALAAAASALPGQRLATVTLPGAPPDTASSEALPRPAPGMAQAFAPPPRMPRGGAPAVAGENATAPLAAPAMQPPRAATVVKPKQLSVPLPVGTAARSSYIIDLGVYINSVNARELVRRLAKLGIHATIHPILRQAQAMTRVTAGPYPNRALAEAARLRIRAHEPNAPAVLVSSPGNLGADQAASALPAGQPGGWVVQLGAFDSAAVAQALKSRALAAGFPAYTDTMRTAQGATLWRVRVGPEASRDAAVALRAQLKAKLAQDGIVAVAH
jgi:cell division septation protein DedD